MEETDKDEVSRNSDFSFRNTLGNLLSDLADYSEALCKSVIISERNSETSYSNIFLEGNQISYENKVVKKPVGGCEKRSATSRKSDRVNDSFSMDKNITASDLCIRNFQAGNSNNTLRKAMITNGNIVLRKPCRISDLMISNCRKTSETVSCIKSEILTTSRNSAEAITSISNTEFSDEGSVAYTSDTDEDSSLDCNSQTSTIVVAFSDSDSNTPSSYLKISEKDLVESSNMMFSEEPLGRFRCIINLQESKLNKRSADVLLKELPNLICSSAEFQDIVHQVTVEAFSELEKTLDNDQRTSISSEEEIENEVSTNFTKTDDEYDRLEAFLCSEDLNTAFANYLSGRNSIPNKTLTFSGTGSEYSHSDLKFTDSDAESYHPDLMLSDSDKESNFDKRSSNVLHVPKELRNRINTTAEFQGIVQEEVINAEAVSNMALTSDNDRGTFVSSHETKENEVSANSMNIDDEYDRLEALLCSKDPNTALQNYFSGRNSISSKVLTFPGTKLALGDERVTSFNSHETMKNEMSINSKNIGNLFGRLRTFIRSKVKKTAPKNNFSGSNLIPSTDSKFSDSGSKTYQSDLKFSNSDQQLLTFKQLKLRNDEEILQMRQKLKEEVRRQYNCPVTSIGCVRTRNNNPNTLVDIFKTVIKCHPIKKFEIPPYESGNAERTFGNLKDPFSKYTCNTMQLHGIDQHRNILECFTDTDSPSVMVFEVTDCFSQNSSIICDGLIKEYLNISAKVNLLLIKQMKDISTEEYELRIRSLRSLDDELGYISAKLITTINDWVKQFHEINQNIAQSRIGSRGLYHMGILRICVKLVSILLKFSFEKQLKLEDYENSLIFHRK